VITPQAHDLGAYLAAGLEPEKILAEHFGRDSGFSRGRDAVLSVADHSYGLLPALPFAGANVPLAAGAALALRGGSSIVLILLDESFLSSGDAHEGLNFAAVLGLPLVVVVEEASRHAGSPSAQPVSVVDRAAAYGIPGVRVDGSDALAVFFATGELAARCRAGLGPSIVHASLGEFQVSGSRQWKRLDGRGRLAAFLRDEGIMNEEQRADLERAVERDVALAADWAEAERMPSGATSQVVYATASAVSARPVMDGR
jgi:pyruvate dehydrogenase E1 component alpha subunit